MKHQSLFISYIVKLHLLNETVVHKFISQKSTVADAVALFVVKEIWFLNFDHDLYLVQITFGKMTTKHFRLMNYEILVLLP